MAPDMNPSDFYEDDEIVEDVVQAYENGERGVTAAPTRSFIFTFVLPQVINQGYRVGEWTSIEVPVATDSLNYAG